MENRLADHQITQHAPDMWQIDEPYQDAYLIIGEKRAVLVDALKSLQTVSLYDEIRAKTSLPIDVLLTHAHFDHAGPELQRLAEHTDVTIYLGAEDFELYDRTIRSGVSVDRLVPFHEGQIWDLGGIALEAWKIAGHTPGSYVFLDRKGNRAFTGDAFGIWLQLESALPVETYRDELKRFDDYLSDYPATVFYTGHLSLCGNTLWDRSYVKELIELSDQILSGQYVGEEAPPMPYNEALGCYPMEGALVAKHGRIWNYVYRPERLWNP